MKNNFLTVNPKQKNFSLNPKERDPKKLNSVPSKNQLFTQNSNNQKENKNIKIKPQEPIVLNSIIKPIQTTIINKKNQSSDRQTNESDVKELDFGNLRTKDENLEYLMEQLDFKEYAFNFIKNKIKFTDLLLLKKEDLNELGLPLGPRNRILKFIEDYNKDKDNTTSSDKLSTIKRTLKSGSSNAEEDSLKKVFSEEMQLDSKSSHNNKDEGFPGIEYSYNFITSPKFAEKGVGNYQTQNFNVGSFNIVKNKFEVNIPDSQRVNYTFKDDESKNKLRDTKKVKEDNKFRTSNTKKSGVDCVRGDLIEINDENYSQSNQKTDKDNYKESGSSYLNHNTSTKNMSLRQKTSSFGAEIKGSQDSKELGSGSKILVKTLGKSNSVVKIRTDKIENDFNNIENKVISFYKNLDELEQRSKERKDRIESILRKSPPLKQNDGFNEDSQNKFVYQKKTIKYENHSQKSTSTRKTVGSYFSGHI